MHASPDDRRPDIGVFAAIAPSPPAVCAYFPELTSRYRQFACEEGLPPEWFDELLAHGYRRCGDVYYQTQCPGCHRCRSYRIPVERFLPSRSQKRVLRRNRDVVSRFVDPVLTAEKEALYLRYQLSQHHEKDRRRHPEQPLPSYDPARLLQTMHYQMYVNPASTREIELWLGDRLLGFGNIDVGREALSAVYFAYDPAEERRSLGTLAILRTLAMAAECNYRYHYLGYWIADHPKMNYKRQYLPAEYHDPRHDCWLPAGEEPADAA